MAKTFISSILTANDLTTGDVVFWTGEIWAAGVDAAEIAHEPDAARALEQTGAVEEFERRVVGAYLVEVDITQPVAAPLARRERIRALGPTFRADLRKPTAPTLLAA